MVVQFGKRFGFGLLISWAFFGGMYYLAYLESMKLPCNLQIIPAVSIFHGEQSYHSSSSNIFSFTAFYEWKGKPPLDHAPETSSVIKIMEQSWSCAANDRMEEQIDAPEFRSGSLLILIILIQKDDERLDKRADTINETAMTRWQLRRKGLRKSRWFSKYRVSSMIEHAGTTCFVSNNPEHTPKKWSNHSIHKHLILCSCSLPSHWGAYSQHKNMARTIEK